MQYFFSLFSADLQLFLSTIFTTSSYDSDNISKIDYMFFESVLTGSMFNS